MLKINNQTTMKGINMIIETTLNKLPKDKKEMFYRKATQVYSNKWYSINHYNRCDKTYSVDSITNGYANEIFLKATTTVYYER